MLAYKNRFHGHGSLRFVYKNGRAARAEEMTLKFSLNPRRKTPRIAVVISKKVLKSAVGRNRIRRRIYEVIRQNLTNLTSHNLDMVFIVSSSKLRDIEASELETIITNLLTQAKIYKKTN